MSRVGKKPISIPEKVDVKIEGSLVRVKGPLGELTWELHPMIGIEQVARELHIKPKKDMPALFGTTRARIANLVHGVEKGFAKTLEIHGLGFKANLQGKTLVLNLGYSHPVDFAIPEGVTIEVDKKSTTLNIRGISRDAVGETAAQIRSLRKPEPYKGKGIRYTGERVRRKAGKTAAGAGAGKPAK